MIVSIFIRNRVHFPASPRSRYAPCTWQLALWLVPRVSGVAGRAAQCRSLNLGSQLSCQQSLSLQHSN